jgi:hypothetical protein
MDRVDRRVDGSEDRTPLSLRAGGAWIASNLRPAASVPLIPGAKRVADVDNVIIE